MPEQKTNPSTFRGAILNLYPDSCGGNLSSLVKLLQKDELFGVFSSLYLLPSLFLSDLDRGFSIISYELNDTIATQKDLETLRSCGYTLMLDFVLNHLSIQSMQFKDLLKKGNSSIYKDFFIDWNIFWEGKGKLNEIGCLIPDEKLLNKLFLRKPELPVLEIPYPDGSTHFFWNTFYQNVSEKKGEKHYLGQMDLNANSQLVWDFYEKTLDRLKLYGAAFVRLDAFAYLHKEIGQSNFFNEPGTWEILERLKKTADERSLRLLPEIHGRHEEGIHCKLAEKGYLIYDFFFPGLIIYSLEKKNTTPLLCWLKEIQENGYETVTMLGCHDGIPLLDMQGLLSEEQIGELILILQHRGGRVKDLYGPDGKKISYYQVNTTFYSALDENDGKMLLARAVQMFMPGIPQIWYLDLFAGTNDYKAADTIGHKEINRTNLSLKNIEKKLKIDLVQNQLNLIRFRNNHPAFSEGASLIVKQIKPSEIILTWKMNTHWARLTARFDTVEYTIESS